MKKIFYAFIISAGLTQAAYATLGEHMDSVDSDKKALSAVRKSSIEKASYSVKEIDAGGTKIREYISKDGIVFGVAWNGLAHPDLTILLGTYYPEYQRELKQNPPRRGRAVSHSAKTGNIVVEKGGHQRDLRGRAYIPSRLPSGVKPSEIK
jgi:hypothetical protein